MGSSWHQILFNKLGQFSPDNGYIGLDYGNLFYDHRTESGSYSDGLITTTGNKGYHAENTKIYNNTIINTDCRIDASSEFSGTSEAKNNLFWQRLRMIKKIWNNYIKK